MSRILPVFLLLLCEGLLFAQADPREACAADLPPLAETAAAFAPKPLARASPITTTTANRPKRGSPQPWWCAPFRLAAAARPTTLTP